MEDLPIFQERLLLARRRAGVSQGELASALRCMLPISAKWSGGECCPLHQGHGAWQKP
jgi:hypothetical protein